MNGFDRPRTIAVLIYLAMALFVATGYFALRHRGWARRATILLYAGAVALALIEILRWLAGAEQ